MTPTPQELEEEAANAMPEPTEAPREVGYCRKRQINIGDLDITIEKTAMGAEKKFPYQFFLRAEKESSWARFINHIGRATAGVRLSIALDVESPFSA